MSDDRADLLGRIERAAAEAQREHQGNEPWTWINWTPEPPWASFIALCDPATIDRMVRIVRAAREVNAARYIYGPTNLSEGEHSLRAALSAFDDLEAERTGRTE